VEALDREFVLGVQWHAECLVDREVHARLFSEFVAAARGFRRSREQLTLAA